MITLDRTVSTGSGKIDAYATVGGTGAEFTNFVPPGAEAGSFAGTLTDLATCATALAVGNYATKYRWDADVGGTFVDQGARVQFTLLSSSSSRGPTRKGAVKPDIVGPGDVVNTAFSQESLGSGTDPNDVGPDGRHAHVPGTSFSAPHVAGIVALMLDKNGYATPSDIRTALQSSANTDQSTGMPVTAQNSWGAGKVNASGAVTATPAPPANSPPAAPASLEQRDSADTMVSVGGSVTDGIVEFRATLTDPESQYVKLQIEVKPVGTAFDGTVSVESLFTDSGSVAKVSLGSLVNGDYHWRARTFDTGGGAGSAAMSSAWASFGGNLETEADFIVAIPSGGGGGGGGCGLLGLEPLSVFFLLSSRRRRRARP